MNILNIPKEEVDKKIKDYDSEKDNFELFFKIGRQYMEKYGINKVNINSKSGQEQIRKIIFAMTEETFEFCQELKNKSWTQEDYPVDEQHAMEEICDIFSFFIQLLLMLDFDANKFRELYIRKEIVNNWRQETNY